MAVTGRGRRWEIWNSLWIVWTLIPGLAWVSFLSAGLRAHQRRWLHSSAIYGLLWVALFTAAGIAGVGGTNRVADALGIALLIVNLVAWPVAIAHAYRIRAEYLLRLEALIPSAAYEEEMLRRRIQQEYRGVAPVSGTTSTPLAVHGDAQAVVVPDPAIAPPRATLPVEINTAAPEDLASLPGVDEAAAARAVAARERIGGFASIEDFGDAIGLQPHVVERLRPQVTCTPHRYGAVDQRPGRLVDY